MQCELMLKGVERLRSESPRFWTDKELQEAVEQDVQSLWRTVGTRRFGKFGEYGTVERQVVQSLMDFDSDTPGEYEGRYRTLNVKADGPFFGRLSTQTSCSDSQESIAAMLDLADYLKDCAKWLSEEP